jgi:hypothetical protein
MLNRPTEINYVYVIHLSHSSYLNETTEDLGYVLLESQFPLTCIYLLFLHLLGIIHPLIPFQPQLRLKGLVQKHYLYILHC